MFRRVSGGSTDSLGAVWAWWAREGMYSTNAELIRWSRELSSLGKGGDSQGIH